MGDTCAVSILVPICNVERYLGECLESIVNQTLEDLQIICIDDGSSDSSPLILEEYARRDRRIEVITKPNSGYGDSMNKGLERARGKYVGIVESDDFVSPKMFESLFEQAELFGADVVKENFFEHFTKDPVWDDTYVNNIPLESYGTVQQFGSEDIRIAMYGRPAIWSALYNRSFLERNHIRFLPTPGASYQDTSFNFKAFAYADKVVFLPTAHLHYRIDNEGSSVNSKQKADFICREYEEVRKTAQAIDGRKAWLRRIVPPIQFGGYDWNLDRLSEELRFPFYRRFVSEFNRFRREGWLDESAFDPIAWDKLNQMLDDPEGYYTRTFGPIDVATTCILNACGETAPFLAEAVAQLTGSLGDGCEILIDVHDGCRDAFCEAVDDLCAAHPHVFPVRRSFGCKALKTVSADRLRGAVVVAIEWRNPSDDVAELASACAARPGRFERASNGSSAAAYEKDMLASLELPLSTILLPTPYYLAQGGALALGDIERIAVQATVSADGAIMGECSAKDYGSAVAVVDALARGLDGAPYREAVRAKALLAPLWNRLQAAFDLMSYGDRKKAGLRPSPKTMPHCVYEAPSGSRGKGAGAAEQPHMTVVIPVFNARSTIADCLESVLLQTDRSLQVICVDDGSTDDSLSILEQFADVDRRLLVVSQFNGGAGSARNTAISMARGEYVAFIDSDDTYPSNDTLEVLYRSASDNGARICGGSFALLEPDGGLSHPFRGAERAYVFSEERFRNFAEDQYDYGWIRFMYHRSLFEEDGVTFPEMYWYEDPVFFASMMKACPRYYAVPRDAYCYHSVTKKLEWSVRQVRDLLKGIQGNLAFAEEEGYPALFATLVDRLNRAYYDAIMSAIDDDEVFERLVTIQGDVMASRFRASRLFPDWQCVLTVLKDLRSPVGDNAIVRMAKRVGTSPLYSALQKAAVLVQEGRPAAQGQPTWDDEG